MGTKKGTLVDNLDNSPPDMNKIGNLGGRVRTANGTIALETGDLDANDIILLARLPVQARILSIKLYNDDLDSNGTPTLAFNLGIWEKDGTVKDADAYASAVDDLQAAVTDPAELAFEARDINKMGQTIWEDAGDSSDPGGVYDIGLEISTGAATAAAGDLSFAIQYVID